MLDRRATSSLPQGVVPPAEAAAMTLAERAARTMAAGYRVSRVDRISFRIPAAPPAHVADPRRVRPSIRDRASG